jgi:hypothetical protein
MMANVNMPPGTVFRFGGRKLQITRVVGDDPASPVILDDGGQLCLWSLDSVRRAMESSNVCVGRQPARRRRQVRQARTEAAYRQALKSQKAQT